MTGSWRRHVFRERPARGHLQVHAAAQGSREELLKQVICPGTWYANVESLCGACAGDKNHADGFCLYSQIEERKRLHAKLMEKVRERGLGPTGTEVSFYSQQF